MENLVFITLGEAGVGKTTFAKSAAKGRAHTKDTIATVALDSFIGKYNYNRNEYTIILRDTAGTERYRSVTQQYIRGCDGAFLMFDKNHSSIKDLEYWREFYEKYVDNPEWVLVKTKCDSQSQEDRNMDCGQFVKFARTHGKPFFEVSAREYKGVEEALEALVARALHRRERASCFSGLLCLHHRSTDSVSAMAFGVLTHPTVKFARASFRRDT